MTRLNADDIRFTKSASASANRMSKDERGGISSALHNQKPIAFDSAHKVNCMDGDDPVYRCKYHPKNHRRGGVRALYVARHMGERLVMLVVGVFYRDENPYGDNK